MEFEQIAYEVRGTTAIVTLNRPERRNALSSKLLRELNAALREADEYNPVHCVVLKGAGPHFCAGADLNEYSSGRGPDDRARTEIDDDTRDIALEAAHFRSATVARMSRRHKLSSEASRRFDRGVDPVLGPYASARAAFSSSTAALAS